MVIIFEIYDKWDMLSWWTNNSAYGFMERPIYMYSLMKISSHPTSNCVGISDILKGFQSFYTSEPLNNSYPLEP